MQTKGGGGIFAKKLLIKNAIYTKMVLNTASSIRATGVLKF
jgi:hypothetical protein